MFATVAQVHLARHCRHTQRSVHLQQILQTIMAYRTKTCVPYHICLPRKFRS